MQQIGHRDAHTSLKKINAQINEFRQPNILTDQLVFFLYERTYVRTRKIVHTVVYLRHLMHEKNIQFWLFM